MKYPCAAALAVLTTLTLAACTPTNVATMSPSGNPSLSSASQTTTPITPATSPTPPPTWNAQQQAAIRAVEEFSAASTKIAQNPSGFTKTEMTLLLKKTIGGDLIASNVTFYLNMKARGFRQIGEGRSASIEASPVSDNGRGDEVHVTLCRDLKGMSVVDRNGDPVADEAFQYPAFTLRQFSVRRPPGERVFRVFGVQTVTGVCGP